MPLQAQQPETPTRVFKGRTPYEDYVRTDVLTHLQHPRSADPAEMAFLVTTQVMELWFTVIVHEWETAACALGQDRVPVAMAALKRSVRELEALTSSWKPLGRLTPAQFNSFRGALGDASGFQSVMYRRMEFLLGEKSASVLIPYQTNPDLHAELQKALHDPSLYDQTLRLLARRGHAIPESVLRRDVARRYEPSPDVEAVWITLYAGDEGGELVRLGEALTDVAELMWRWRHDHLLAVSRAMGAKAGTGGSTGLAWLQKRVQKHVFPELWTARSHV